MILVWYESKAHDRNPLLSEQNHNPALHSKVKKKDHNRNPCSAFKSGAYLRGWRGRALSTVNPLLFNVSGRFYFRRQFYAHLKFKY